MKIGIYPGTFDPVHAGHVALAVAGIDEIGLEQVVFLPEEEPRSKQNVTLFKDRLAMLELVMHDRAKLKVERLHSKRFTVNATLPEIQHTFPDDELTLLIGSDVSYSLAGWEGIESLAKQCNLIVGVREGDPVTAIRKSLRNIPGLRYKLVTTDQYHVRSSLIKLHNGIEYVDDRVAQYIEQHNLYNTQNN